MGILTTSASEVERYITHLDWGADGNGKITYLKTVIDTLTFEELGSSFYKDKNNIYSFFSRLGGGMFHTVDADIKTSQVLGDCYAKDKNHIYVVAVKVPLQKNVGAYPCACPHMQKQHDKQKTALNIIGAGRPQGSHPTKKYI